MARLTAVADVVRLSRATTRNIRQTLVCANACIVALLPVAAGALSGFGIALSPVPAAVVMAPSGVFVLSNALPLRRFRPLHRAIR